MPGNSHHVLLVEDSVVDEMLLREALRRAGIAITMHVARDGERALQFLRREGEFAGAPPVRLLLLDLNMPRFDGRHLLAAIRGDAELAALPLRILVLSTSDSPVDDEQVQALGAHGFITKPLGFEGYLQLGRRLRDTWLDRPDTPA